MAEKMRPIYDYSVLYHLGVIESAFPRNKGVKAALGMVRDVVNSAPTVSPDEVRGVGKWIDKPYFTECSICHAEFDSEVTCSEIYGWPWVHCPNCGAKMEVSE